MWKILLLALALAGCSPTASHKQMVEDAVDSEEVQVANSPQPMTSEPEAAGIPVRSASREIASIERSEEDQPPRHFEILKRMESAKVIATTNFTTLQPASTTIQAPESVNIDNVAEIAVTIALAKAINKLPSENVVVRKDIQVARVVSVELHTDQTAFRVESFSNTRQPLFDDRAPTWKWNLTPLKAGKHDVHISIHNVVQVDGRDEFETTEVLKETVTVEVTVWQSTKMLFNEHWKWIWGAIISPLIAWFAKAQYEKFRARQKT